MKIVQEQQLHLKMKFLLGYNMKVFSLGDKNLTGDIFPGWGEWTNFQLLGELPTIPSVGKTVHAVI